MATAFCERHHVIFIFNQIFCFLYDFFFLAFHLHLCLLTIIFKSIANEYTYSVQWLY